MSIYTTYSHLIGRYEYSAREAFIGKKSRRGPLSNDLECGEVSGLCRKLPVDTSYGVGEGVVGACEVLEGVAAGCMTCAMRRVLTRLMAILRLILQHAMCVYVQLFRTSNHSSWKQPDCIKDIRSSSDEVRIYY